MNFLEKLDYLMEKRSINKSKLSKMSGVPYTTIDGFYKKGYENTKLSTIRKISEALNVSLDYLFDESSDEKSPSTAETALGEELKQEIIRLAGDLSPEHQDLFLAILRLIAARNQGLCVAALVSAGEEVLKSEIQNSTR